MSNSSHARFRAVFPVIRDQLLEHIKGEGMPEPAVQWYRKNLDYNVPGGKLIRGPSVVDTVEILKGRSLTDDEYIKAAVLGWCVEPLQAYFLVSDDIMDASITRRSQPCWYRNVEVGMIAINDSFMLESAIYRLLKVHFKDQPYYIDLMDLFHETTYQTEMGQLLDLINAPEDKVDPTKFSLEKHRLIVIYKTAYYSFYLPVALAMYMLLGEIGTDIVDNKCSWCINVALSLADGSQRAIIDENYGRKDPVKEARVKEVYEQVGLRKVYSEYEEKTDVFTSFLNKIYKRTK
ncbi:hypothetical protein AMATHDRAFT_76816 [Amanita thiersii Skay4041]|uniref:Farnesyl diphosphate synthase n=1 Tax=Amanita thiersii Skay4041 TaxID=703135 RepID=A0A2A9NKM0_9AGAR|nr:hypothetical protein AMATHDRAFT_76816 [Amanita thiersii Skay4041]